MGRWLVYDAEVKMKYKELRKDLHILEQISDEIFVLCIADINTRQRWICCDRVPSHNSIQAGLDLLANAEIIIAHNGSGFDTFALKAIHPTWTPQGKSIDSLVMSQLVYPDLYLWDMKRKGFDRSLFGKHSLKAWGIRQGNNKGDYDKGFTEFHPDMIPYCEQDVEVTLSLFAHLHAKHYSMDAIIMESRFREIITQQQLNGVDFDHEAAEELYKEIDIELQPILVEIEKTVPDWVEHEEFTPKVNNKTRGYVKGETIIREHITKFNPNSRQQIVKFFKNKYSWKPEKFTKDKKGNFTTNPQIDHEVMDSLPFPEAELFSRFLVRKALLSKIQDAAGSWLNLVRTSGKVHGKMNTLGTRTRRCTHSLPNISQVPAPGKYKGEECRKLFTAPKGYKIVGCDMSGIQLRMLAHYLCPYDNGRYAEIVLNGDIHTANQEAAGLPTRPSAKTFIYAWLFGGGAALLGAILHPKGSETIKKNTGNRLKSSFLAKTPGIAGLMRDVKLAHKNKKKMKLIDGGSVPSPAEHTALNTLLQGSDSVCCKNWCVMSHDMLKEAGLDKYARQIIQSHDEQEYLVKEEYAESVGEILKKAATLTGEKLGTRIRLDAEYRIGDNWYEVH